MTAKQTLKANGYRLADTCENCNHYSHYFCPDESICQLTSEKIDTVGVCNKYKSWLDGSETESEVIDDNHKL